MKIQTALLLICMLIQSATADYETDLKINQTYVAFMKQFQGFVQKTTIQLALQAYKSQGNSDPSQKEIKKYSSAEVQQLSNKMTAQIVSQYQSIAYRIIHDAGYNTRGNYYIYDSHTKQWHRPNMSAPANPINGKIVNSQILRAELHNAFLNLMSTNKMNSKVQKRSYNFLPAFKGVRFYSSVTKNTKDFVEQISYLPDSVKVKRLHKKLLELAEVQTPEANIDRKYLTKQMKEAQLRRLEQEQHVATLAESNRNTKQWLSISWEDMFKDRIAKVVGTFLMGYGLIALFSNLFERDENASSISNNVNESDRAGLSDQKEFSESNVEPSSTSSDVAGTTPIRYDFRPVIPPPPTPDDSSELLPPPPVQPLHIVNDLISDTSAPQVPPTNHASNLPKTITQNGITYYLDEYNFRYYYVDPSTNKAVYYSV